MENTAPNQQQNERESNMRKKKLSNPFTSHSRFDCKNITDTANTSEKKANWSAKKKENTTRNTTTKIKM